MNNLVLSNILRFLFLLLVQVVVVDNITLSSLVMPNVCVLFIMMLPTSVKRIPLLLISFGVGLLLDLSSNMLGYQTFAFTMMGMMRVVAGNRILVRNEPIEIEVPSIYSPTFQQFAFYAVLLLMVYYVSLILIEAFSFYNAWHLAMSIVINIAITWVIIIVYQFVFMRKEE